MATPKHRQPSTLSIRGMELNTQKDTVCASSSLSGEVEGLTQPQHVEKAELINVQ